MAIFKAINNRRGSKTHGALRNCLEYVLRPEKTAADTLCFVLGPYQHRDIDYNKVYGAFLDVKKEWDKDSSRMYTHSVLSFPKDEKLTPEQALEFGIRFAEKTYEGFQTVVAVHTDKEHIHCHLVTNTVSYIDGHKLQKSRKDLKAEKEYCNDLCREYGLSVAQKGKHADGTDIGEGEIISWQNDKYQALINSDNARPSYLINCGIAVIQSLNKAKTREDFITEMQNRGWSVQWSDTRKHITFMMADGRKVRDTNLSKTFNMDISKEVIDREFAQKAGYRREARPGNSEREHIAERRKLANKPKSTRTKKRGRTASI